MLTDKARHERKWSWIPTLGQFLSSKEIPERYFGVSSTSDNHFDRVRRLMEIAILIKENYTELKYRINNGTQLEKRQIQEELHRVASALESVGNEFLAQSRQLLQ